jgi:hypothetical protein
MFTLKKVTGNFHRGPMWNTIFNFGQILSHSGWFQMVRCDLGNFKGHSMNILFSSDKQTVDIIVAKNWSNLMVILEKS